MEFSIEFQLNLKDGLQRFVIVNPLEPFEIASEKFMDIANLETFANCYSNHIDVCRDGGIIPIAPVH